MKNRMLKIACQPEMSRWVGPGFSERPIFRRNPLEGFLNTAHGVAVKKLRSKILIAMVFAVRMANLEGPADGIFLSALPVQMRHLRRKTSLFSWACEALAPAFCVHKTQRNSHGAMKILLELSRAEKGM